MTLTREDPELARPIESASQLLDYFRQAEKPPADWRIGTEHEKIGMYQETLDPIPYAGDRGIAALLSALVRDHGFAPLTDEGRLVGLERDGASITLEPGGQLELSGAPLTTLHETCREFQSHLSLMKHVCQRFDIIWLGLGIHPLAKIEEVPRMPRARYTIMREFLSSRGAMALEMMHATGSIQVNLDYGSEADLARKLRVALALSPVVTALYANSSISGGGPNGWISRRAWVWRHTDPARCGLLPFVFDEGWGEGTAYRRYADWALDVPMVFILRDQRHIPMHGQSFRDFLEHGHGEFTPILADWNLHLTTLFPEVRLKKVIEMRSADAVPPGLVCALPALWKGLLYDDATLREAERRVENWSFEEVDALHAEVARSALESRTPGGPTLEMAKDLLDLAAGGLKKLDARNRAGDDETLFLDPLYEILDRGSSPGQDLLERWEGAWSRRTDLLVEYSKY
jgi:glutamate--cysteine ligase